MEKERTFELVPVLDEETGIYKVKNFEDAKAIVVEYLDENVGKLIEKPENYTINDIKAMRTEIRKKKDAITQARINTNALLLGTFNSQLKEIETTLDSADKKLKERVDAYNLMVKGNDVKPKIITLVVKGYDAKAIEKVRNIALQNGLSAEVK